MATDYYDLDVSYEVEKEVREFVRNHYDCKFGEIQKGSFIKSNYEIDFIFSYDKLKNHRRVDILNVVLKNS